MIQSYSAINRSFEHKTFKEKDILLVFQETQWIKVHVYESEDSYTSSMQKPGRKESRIFFNSFL